MCRLTPGLCACGVLPRIDLPVEVLVVQHHKERHSQSNTGALTHRLLARSRLLRFAPRSAPFDATPLLQPGTVVLWPERGEPLAPGRAPARIVVLDATWRQARRMSTRIEGLRRMPFATLPPTAPRWVLREPPAPGRLSTVEAIACAIECLGFHEQAAAMYGALDLVMSRLVRLRCKPHPDGRAPTRSG